MENCFLCSIRLNVWMVLSLLVNSFVRGFSFVHGLYLLKTFIFRVDVMSQFNVFDDLMDISIELLIVL